MGVSLGGGGQTGHFVANRGNFSPFLDFCPNVVILTRKQLPLPPISDVPNPDQIQVPYIGSHEKFQSYRVRLAGSPANTTCNKNLYSHRVRLVEFPSHGAFVVKLVKNRGWYIGDMRGGRGGGTQMACVPYITTPLSP